MREGCVLIVRLDIDKAALKAYMEKTGEKFFDVVTDKLGECEEKYGGCFDCPDFKQCDTRWNGICKKAEGISPPWAIPDSGEEFPVRG